MTLLTDIRESFKLYAICVPCDRLELLALPDLIAALGTDATVATVRRRVRCQRCGNRTQDIRIVYVGRCGKVAGFHYRQP